MLPFATTQSKTAVLEGVFAAAVTPLDASGAPDLAALPKLIGFLAGRGCHGVLLLGTTGEGPSFSVRERIEVVREGLRYRAQAWPKLQILAGTGCANLADTIALTRAAFDLGADAVVTLPPFYYKDVSPEGIASYFEQVVRSAVPAGGRLLAYHIPQVSGVGIPAASLHTLRQQFPSQVWGMKDSQDNLAHTLETIDQFPGLHVFSGSDSTLAEALAGGASGSITALANVTSLLNRAVWDAHQKGSAAPEAQQALVRARQVVKGLSGPAAMKAALADLFGFPDWPVRAPLERLPSETRSRFSAALAELLSTK
jgi:4-hydroxy-tetrahydrodipicolinate synthase